MLIAAFNLTLIEVVKGHQGWTYSVGILIALLALIAFRNRTLRLNASLTYGECLFFALWTIRWSRSRRLQPLRSRIEVALPWLFVKTDDASVALYLYWFQAFEPSCEGSSLPPYTAHYQYVYRGDGGLPMRFRSMHWRFFHRPWIGLDIVLGFYIWNEGYRSCFPISRLREHSKDSAWWKRLVVEPPLHLRLVLLACGNCQPSCRLNACV